MFKDKDIMPRKQIYTSFLKQTEIVKSFCLNVSSKLSYNRTFRRGPLRFNWSKIKLHVFF